MSESEQDRAVLEFMERKSPSAPGSEDESQSPTAQPKSPLSLDLTSVTNNRPSPSSISSARSLLQNRQKNMLDPIVQVEKSRCMGGWQSAREPSRPPLRL